ncbi:MAG: tRNA 2-thiouridine(34) synthase MnmA [Planctomycetota bacterium]|jgi:tRNA-specific 2-thiouridylase
MRILAALSGGVDSAVAAARLQRGGADVVGVHLRTGVESDGEGGGGSRSCCGADDARDARAVATRLGIPFYVVDVADAFTGVVAAFVASYAAGETPNPCVACNRDVKFGRLLEIARGLGCDAVATGHYARRIERPGGRIRLLRAFDDRKDQSYVLYALDQAQLRAARFPLGDDRKPDVREEARGLGLTVADKRDSQELCFVPSGDYRRFLRENAPAALVPGEIADEDGRIIGRHDGAAGFTRGQRRGLPAVGSPRYVTDVDAVSGRVTVGPRAAALEDRVHVADVNWVDREDPGGGPRLAVSARIRHAAPAEPAHLQPVAEGRAEVTFERPVFAPAPGQALVAYEGDAVLCGGRILADRKSAGAPADPAQPGSERAREGRTLPPRERTTSF